MDVWFCIKQEPRREAKGHKHEQKRDQEATVFGRKGETSVFPLDKTYHGCPVDRVTLGSWKNKEF